MSRLDEAQAEAAAVLDHCLVVACPGSGKTRTLAAKAAKILSRPDARVCAVTFTRDAAVEIRRRILEEAGRDAAGRLAAGTFHGLCWRQLGLAREPVASEGERIAYAARAAADARADLDPEDALRLIEAGKAGQSVHFPGVDVERMVRAYQDILSRNGKLDFQDLIARAVDGMRRGAVRPVPADFLLVDEFQDTDESQLAWVMEHAAAGAKVTAVGDDDQCHPPQTRIATNRGWMRIEYLDPGRVAIAAFDTGAMRPFATRDYRLVRMPFEGHLLEIVVEDAPTVLCTPDHRWWVRPSAGGGAPFLAAARNLIAEAVEIPAVDGWGRASWRLLRTVKRVAYRGPVFGLEVLAGGLYVAEGLVTHNSIYGWRRALGHAGMERFADLLGARRVALGTNYRSRREIVEAAARLVERNRGRIRKPLRAARPWGGRIAVKAFKTPMEEAAAVAEAAARSPKGFAVLARANHLLDPVEAALAARGVPYERLGGSSIFDREEAAVMADLLRLAAGTGNGAGVDHALAWAGMLEDDLRALHARFGAAVVAGSPKDYDGLPVTRAGVELWRELARRLAGWRLVAGSGGADLVVEAVAQWMESRAPDKRSAVIVDYARMFFAARRGTLEERLRGAGERRKREQDGGAVHLVTMHGAKGLEWDEVWIVGAEETITPDDQAPLEEERRLFYVAMTRAREALTVSHTDRHPPSRFLDEFDRKQP